MSSDICQIDMTGSNLTRREATKLIGAGTAGLLLPIDTSRTEAAGEPSSILTRAIPASGEKLPVIGLGTWRVFDVGSSERERMPLEQVLRLFAQSGAHVIDSSPMYGRAEQVIGDLTSKLGLREKLFFATKVWTRGKQAGIESMERSLARFQTKRIDLMQVHNLVDVSTQLATMREWKAQGRVRYIGVTHYEASAFPSVEKILRAEQLDFLQINYSIMEREAEQQILPLAQERGVAVIANRPFGGGNLFGRVRSTQLPDWVAEFDCKSWAQFFLKWIVAHPAVTCAIPATANANHLEDDIQGGIGRTPDAKMRQRMVECVSSI
jgi:diketogulonate reductase-like aldo/keto reductase